MILTFLRVYFKKLVHKTIEYQNFKIFYNDEFLHELGFELSKGTIYKYKNNHIWTMIFKMVLDKYVPIKGKKIRGYHAPSMPKELSKEIVNRYKFGNKYLMKTS